MPNIKVDTKFFLKSKTILFNGLTVLVVLATHFGFTPNQELAEEVTKVLIALVPIVNIVLRFITSKSVHL